MSENEIQLNQWPNFEQDEIEASTHILTAGGFNLVNGTECRKFEQEFASYIGLKHAISLINCSVALEIALKALDIGKGDEVIVPCRSFIASASSIVLCGAVPVFADVDLDTGNILPQSFKDKITSKTKAVICVHIAGCPCDMELLLTIAKEHNLKVIEDCAQAHGASYKGKKVGSFGDVSVFSFCNDKIMSCAGEGGMLLTNDEAVYKKTNKLSENYPMAETQATIGRIQLTKLDKWVSQRRANAKLYNEAFEKLEAVYVPKCESIDFDQSSKASTLRGGGQPQDGRKGEEQFIVPNIYHSFYKYYLYIKPERLKEGCNRDTIVEEIRAKGIPAISGVCCELYKEEAFVNYFKGNHPILPNAHKLAETSIMLPVHPTLSEQNLKDIIAVTVEAVKHNAK